MGGWLEDAESSARAQSNPRRLFSSFCAWLDWRDELAGGEVVQGAEAAGDLVVAQAVLAIERSEKLFGGAFPLLRVAIQAARDEVTVGVAAGLRARHNVVDAPPFTSDGAQTIKAAALLAGVDGLAQGPRSQEILLLEVDSGVG